MTDQLSTITLCACALRVNKPSCVYMRVLTQVQLASGWLRTELQSTNGCGLSQTRLLSGLGALIHTGGESGLELSCVNRTYVSSLCYIVTILVPIIAGSLKATEGAHGPCGADERVGERAARFPPG